MTLKDVKIYDNGGETIDRYTAVYMNLPDNPKGTYSAVAMNSKPFAPQGFGQHVTAAPGLHLGKPISFFDLPEDCRRLIMQDIEDVNKNSNRPMGL